MANRTDIVKILAIAAAIGLVFRYLAQRGI
jgi:hypothetical protein